MSRDNPDALLLGEWACLGALYGRRTHGFAVAARLAPGGDLGRIWSLSRPLTYRCLDQLVRRGHVAAVGTEPGRAGGERTILTATRRGRAELRRWLRTPVAHLRDLRSELLLKLTLGAECSVDQAAMLAAQRAAIVVIAEGLRAEADRTNWDDLVIVWRLEMAGAALRFLDRLTSDANGGRRRSPTGGAARH